MGTAGYPRETVASWHTHKGDRNQECIERAFLQGWGTCWQEFCITQKDRAVCTGAPGSNIWGRARCRSDTRWVRRGLFWKNHRLAGKNQSSGTNLTRTKHSRATCRSPAFVQSHYGNQQARPAEEQRNTQGDKSLEASPVCLTHQSYLHNVKHTSPGSWDIQVKDETWTVSINAPQTALTGTDHRQLLLMQPPVKSSLALALLARKARAVRQFIGMCPASSTLLSGPLSLWHYPTGLLQAQPFTHPEEETPSSLQASTEDINWM